MTTVRVVYFDTGDTDLRAAVLRSAGYTVDECGSIPELAGCLRSERGADLVCVADAWNNPAEGALALAWGLSTAPIVLFRCADHHYFQHVWDLEIPPLTPPSAWLADVAALLAEANAARCQKSRTRSF